MDVMKRSHCIPLFAALWLLGCMQVHDLDMGLPHVTGGAGAGAGVAVSGQPLKCSTDPVDSLTGLYTHLDCAGLYSDIVSKKLVDGAEPYAPAVPLWSDGADKHRFIVLPKGTTIDASAPNDWVFPVGTKFFKEFAVGGHRVETRLFEKQSDRWVRTTYQWTGDESTAIRSDGGDITLAGGAAYHLPTAKECDQCHQGRKDRALGFEQILMGMDAATGMTLSMLAQKKLITPVPANLTPQIADDGTSKAPAVIGWLHVNCGVSCHNDNPSAAGHSTKLRMKLDVAQLDGRSATAYPTLQTTIGVAATTLRWGGKIRITPGSPEQSLLYQLITTRTTGENNQMPPLATNVVPKTDTDAVATWIQSLPPSSSSH
jgi:hypothetical protein